jgi:hypothetical protein
MIKGTESISVGLTFFKAGSKVDGVGGFFR